MYDTMIALNVLWNPTKLTEISKFRDFENHFMEKGNDQIVKLLMYLCKFYM